MIYDTILEKFNRGEKQFALLIDPDKFTDTQKSELIDILKHVTPDLILVGGSLVSEDSASFIQQLKQDISLPIIQYPGSAMQLAPTADAILFLSLLSGRNAEFLISHHVSAAPLIKKHKIEPISTGYILIDGGCTTSVQYISQTQPIPGDKDDMAVATALAGEFLGMKLLYLEAGSGAKNPVPTKLISAVKTQVSIPLIVGGGLNTTQKIKDACLAGADIVVVGNVLEKDISLLREFAQLVKS